MPVDREGTQTREKAKENEGGSKLQREAGASRGPRRGKVEGATEEAKEWQTRKERGHDTERSTTPKQKS